ncbi:hypothetical protein B0H10DRAFT_2216979 [Mycena sp. CBHHK59/15]|nr:hypothetical protein B0H10DRAFT_2216979 [Mycena sp. CBHHK59/15]
MQAKRVVVDFRFALSLVSFHMENIMYNAERRKMSMSVRSMWFTGLRSLDIPVPILFSLEELAIVSTPLPLFNQSQPLPHLNLTSLTLDSFPPLFPNDLARFLTAFHMPRLCHLELCIVPGNHFSQQLIPLETLDLIEVDPDPLLTLLRADPSLGPLTALCVDRTVQMHTLLAHQRNPRPQTPPKLRPFDLLPQHHRVHERQYSGRPSSSSIAALSAPHRLRYTMCPLHSTFAVSAIPSITMLFPAAAAGTKRVEQRQLIHTIKRAQLHHVHRILREHQPHHARAPLEPADVPLSTVMLCLSIMSSLVISMTRRVPHARHGLPTASSASFSTPDANAGGHSVG